MILESKNSSLFNELAEVLIDKKDIFIDVIGTRFAFATILERAEASNP